MSNSTTRLITKLHQGRIIQPSETKHYKQASFHLGKKDIFLLYTHFGYVLTLSALGKTPILAFKRSIPFLK